MRNRVAVDVAAHPVHGDRHCDAVRESVAIMPERTVRVRRMLGNRNGGSDKHFAIHMLGSGVFGGSSHRGFQLPCCKHGITHVPALRLELSRLVSPCTVNRKASCSEFRIIPPGVFPRWQALRPRSLSGRRAIASVSALQIHERTCRLSAPQQHGINTHRAFPYPRSFYDNCTPFSFRLHAFR